MHLRHRATESIRFISSVLAASSPFFSKTALDALRKRKLEDSELIGIRGKKINFHERVERIVVARVERAKCIFIRYFRAKETKISTSDPVYVDFRT